MINVLHTIRYFKARPAKTTSSAWTTKYKYNGLRATAVPGSGNQATRMSLRVA